MQSGIDFSVLLSGERNQIRKSSGLADLKRLISSRRRLAQIRRPSARSPRLAHLSQSWQSSLPPQRHRGKAPGAVVLTRSHRDAISFVQEGDRRSPAPAQGRCRPAGEVARGRTLRRSSEREAKHVAGQGQCLRGGSHWRTDWRTRRAALVGDRARKERKAPICGGFPMRLNGVEPSRVFPPTRPSTLRVYQFRHSRSEEADSRCLRAGGERTLRSSGGGGTLRTGVRKRFAAIRYR
jgi:hypothetical protein